MKASIQSSYEGTPSPWSPPSSSPDRQSSVTFTSIVLSSDGTVGATVGTTSAGATAGTASGTPPGDDFSTISSKG